ncbi:hypothetical protein VPNG_07160 [Cytospora leucostoma]|uniref:Peptidase M61 catalytic domain-containing protein n=1 Tax=Cytospora leucostoma TaxID=1230097 RepID=A0A423WJJ7_9PEZI|nr:hypothetical protein VPNG_07160 [Cytospora leucostoma]
MVTLTRPSRWAITAWAVVAMMSGIDKAHAAASPPGEQLVIEGDTLAVVAEKHDAWGQGGGGGHEGLPSLHLLLEPLFSEPTTAVGSRKEPIAINITIALTVPKGRFDVHNPLLTLPLKRGATPTARYDSETNPLSAFDHRGNPIPLVYFDEDPVEGPRLWYLDESGQASGKEAFVVYVTFTAPYRKTDEKTQMGPRMDLRRDVSGGGLVGQGMGFIPVPPPPARQEGGENSVKGDDGWAEKWNITVEWDLSDSPEGVHGAWSLGDENTVRTVDTLDNAITHAVFAVGYLQRFPSWDVDITTTSSSTTAAGGKGVYAMYWLEPSPYDMIHLAKSTQEIYSRIAAYFDDSTDPFRVFFRRIEANSGGTGATLSFLLEYSLGSVEQENEHDVADLLAHETVHEFALLDADPPGKGNPEWQEEEGSWYVEGVASYIGALVGLDDPGRREWVVASMNDYAQAYYTSPVVNMSYGDVLSDYWGTVDITRVPYDRGLMYLVQLDGLIGEATQGEKSLDDLIVGLYRLRRDGKPNSLETLKEMAADLVGQEAFERSYAAMFRGDLIVPSKDSLKRYGLTLVEKEWHRFELGFHPNSMRTFKVQGLVIGSNADKAGVVEGDVITRGFTVWSVAGVAGTKMKLTVLRNGEEVTLEWWPRSQERVEAYGFAEVDSNSTPDEL